MNFSEYYNRWVKPYVPDKGDNLLICEGQLRRLLQTERERCAMIVEKIAKRDYHDNWFNQETIDDIAKAIREQ